MKVVEVVVSYGIFIGFVDVMDKVRLWSGNFVSIVWKEEMNFF